MMGILKTNKRRLRLFKYNEYILNTYMRNRVKEIFQPKI